VIILARSETLITAVAGNRLEIWKRWAHPCLRHGSALLLFTLLTLTLAPQAVLHPSRTVVPDLIDPVHHIWSVAVLLRDVRTWPDGLWSLFDGNIFYPVHHAAAFADTFIGLLPLLLPLSLLTQDPATLANLLLGLSFVLSAYGAFVLGWELTKVYPAALVCGLAFGFCPLHVEQVGHVTVASMQWQALAAWCLVRAWHRGTWLWWVFAGLFLGLAAITNLYYLAYLPGPLILAAAALGHTWTRRRVQGVLVTGGLAALCSLPMLIPYLTRQAVVGPGYGAGSTDVLSFVSTMAGRLVDSQLLPTVPFLLMQRAHGLFPGLGVLVLAWMGWRHGRARPWVIYALGCLMLALGPHLLVAGHVLPLPLPYAALSTYVPHFALFRDPTRATSGLALGLAVAAAWGTRAIFVRVQRGRLLWSALVVGLVLLESWTPLPTARLAPIPAGAYWLARQLDIHAVAVLPIANDTPIDWEHQTEIMRESTVNWKWLVNGSESLDPVGMAARRAAMAAYPAPAARRLLLHLHVDAVVLRLPWLSPRQRTLMERSCRSVYRDRIMVVCRVG
jgi:hypothetical protein